MRVILCRLTGAPLIHILPLALDGPHAAGNFGSADDHSLQTLNRLHRLAPVQLRLIDLVDCRAISELKRLPHRLLGFLGVVPFKVVVESKVPSRTLQVQVSKVGVGGEKIFANTSASLTAVHAGQHDGREGDHTRSLLADKLPSYRS